MINLGDIVKINNRHPKIPDIEYRVIQINNEYSYSINHGIGLRPNHNKSSRMTYMSGDVINQEDDNLIKLNDIPRISKKT